MEYAQSNERQHPCWHSLLFWAHRFFFYLVWRPSLVSTFACWTHAALDGLAIPGRDRPRWGAAESPSGLGPAAEPATVVALGGALSLLPLVPPLGG